MTSTIEDPFKGYVIVAQSGSASNTIGNKLEILRTAFENLSADKKSKAFIRRGLSYYNINSLIGIFSHNTIIVSSNGNYVVDMITLGSKKYFEYTFKTSGMTMADLTSDISSSNYELGYWL